MIIYLAGFQGIPTQLYEAAAIDGAARARFWNVTLPMITPVIFFNVVMGIIGRFQVFTKVYVMTKGGAGQRDPLLHALPLPERLPVLQDGLRLRAGLDPVRDHPRAAPCFIFAPRGSTTRASEGEVRHGGRLLDARRHAEAHGFCSRSAASSSCWPGGAPSPSLHLDALDLVEGGTKVFASPPHDTRSDRGATSRSRPRLPFDMYSEHGIIGRDGPRRPALRVVGRLRVRAVAVPRAEALFVLVLSTIMLPGQVTMIPQFILFNGLAGSTR